mmetsp:Transcript_8011/g.20490  ORF Transcript_8011/g.20490 Transcript_8011/m.20490 type:complete len:200 (-) Transcript_8011:211-810(-)
MSSWPYHTALNRGVRPSASPRLRDSLAPCCINHTPMSKKPISAAMWRGVRPSFSLLFTSCGSRPHCLMVKWAMRSGTPLPRLWPRPSTPLTMAGCLLPRGPLLTFRDTADTTTGPDMSSMRPRGNRSIPPCTIHRAWETVPHAGAAHSRTVVTAAPPVVTVVTVGGPAALAIRAAESAATALAGRAMAGWSGLTVSDKA